MLLPLLTGAWLLGMAVAGAWHAPWWLAGAWLLALTPAFAWRRGARGAALCLAAATLALAGGWRYTAAGVPALNLPPGAVGVEIRAEGRVSSEPDPGLTTVTYRVDLDRVTLRDGTTASAKASVLITVNQFTRLLPGDRVLLRGTIREPEADIAGFDYRAYLRSRGIAGRMLYPEVAVAGEGGFSRERAAARMRLAFERALQRSLPEPEASLAAGIAIGRDDAMPPELVDDFRSSGLAHLTAVSGSNVAILSALVFGIAVPLVGRYRAIVPAAVVLALYLVAAGFSPTIVRSTIMAAVFLAGLWLGRPQSGLAGLGVAAVVMTAVDPGVARDVGFQLSFAATGGLIVLSPWLQAATDAALMQLRLAGVAGTAPSQAVALTASATVATLPFVAHTFERVSIVGLAANVLAAPLFLLAFPLSLAAAVAGTAWAPAGWFIGLAAYYPLAAINAIATGSASLPGAALRAGGVGTTAAFAWVALYCAAGWWLYRRLAPRRPPPRATPRERLVRRAVAACVLGGLVAWIGVAALAPIGGPGEMEVHVLDVGQGDAILLRTPDGRNILVDGGPSALALSRELGRVLPHWERRLDVVILTHPQEDHVAGLAGALARFEAGLVAANGRTSRSIAFAEFERRAGGVTHLAAGDSIVVGGVRLDVLWPPAGGATAGSPNDASLVLRVTYGDAVLLLTGDIERAAQRALGERGGFAAQVLKVPHHGAATSDSAFLAAVNASVALVSVGRDNRFGHPATATLAALDGTAIYRTDEHGRITLRSDGKRWRIATAR